MILYILFVFIIFRLFYIGFEFVKFTTRKWIKLGKHPYRFEFLDFIYLLIFLGVLFLQFFWFTKSNFVIEDLVMILGIFLFSIKRNYYMIIKKEKIGIVINTFVQNYDKNEIKYIAIKNNNLAIALVEDKVYNFPIEYFKRAELNSLKQFVTIENIEDKLLMI